MSTWVDAQLERMAREAEALTDDELRELIERFRTGVGGLYILIGDHLEAHDPRRRIGA